MKKIIYLTTTIFCFFGFFINSQAQSIDKNNYNSLDLEETLADEQIKASFSNYEESKDKITIYMFRGKGCDFCRAFLNYLNSITNDYGKYFNLESYEVWNDVNNSNMLNTVAEFLGYNPYGSNFGVPFIIIGNKVFPGYNESFDDEIKETIVNLYNSKEKYDIFAEINKETKVEKSSDLSSYNGLIWNFIFIGLSTFIIIIYINIRFNELNEKLDIIKVDKG